MTSHYSLKRYAFFATLDDVFIKKIQMLGETKELATDEWLFKQEESANDIYLITEGKIALTIMYRDHIIDRMNPYMRGEIIGWSALVKPHIYTMGAISEGPSKVIGFNGKKMLALMDENKDQGYVLLQNLTEIIGGRLINRNIQLMSIRT